MKAYVTKYALTEGIRIVDGRVSAGGKSSMLCYITNGWSQYAHGEGRDWHRTWAAAVARAKHMRDAKLASIAKSKKRLEALDWPDTERAQ